MSAIDQTRQRVAIRQATLADVPHLVPIMQAAIDELQRGFLDGDQIRSSHAIMGLDTRLVEDGTYYVATLGGELAGCGGWSRRATLYGADHSAGRSSRLLDPRTEPARIRAMYTHPRHARKGVGRAIIETCERAARDEGFKRMELMGTLAGEPLYARAGFTPVERLTDASGGAAVPLVRMAKAL
jgi:GNAT superfamily N-acetyltransferase